MSLINTQLKPFRAQAYHQGDFTEITDETVRGRWSVFFFYPADFTFVCPTELEDLAAKHDELQKLGVDVYGVSCDTHFSHKAWHASSEKVGKVQFAAGHQFAQATRIALFLPRQAAGPQRIEIARQQFGRGHGFA